MDNSRYNKTEFMLGNVRRENLLSHPPSATGYTIGNGYEACRQCEFCGRQLPYKDTDAIFEAEEYPCWTWKALVAGYTICDYFQEKSQYVIDRIIRRRR